MNGWRRVLACAALLLLTKGAGAVGGDWRLATLELPPSIASSLPNQGYYAVLLRRVLAEFGAQPQFVFLPAQRAYQDTASGGYDAAFPYKRTPECEQLFLFSEPFYVARVRVFLNADRRWQPETVAELRGRRGCTLIGAQSPDLLQRDIDQGLVPMQRVSLIEACFRMLQLGRVDFAVAGQNTGWAAVRQLAAQGKGFHMADFVLAEEPVALAFPRALPESAARLRAFNAALKKLRAAGVLQQIEAQHVPAPPGAP